MESESLQVFANCCSQVHGQHHVLNNFENGAAAGPGSIPLPSPGVPLTLKGPTVLGAEA